MKKAAAVLWIYALLLLIGGLIGYLKAGSLISLGMSSFFGIFITISAFFVWSKNSQRAFYIAASLLICLLAFFAYRFIVTHQIMPAGFMALLTAATLYYIRTLRIQN